MGQINHFEDEIPRVARTIAVERDRVQLILNENIVQAMPPRHLETEICIGDFCLIQEDSLTDEFKRIEKIFDRKSLLQRKSVGESSRHQQIAANVDTVFLVSSLTKEFNLSRMERYLLAIRESKANPAIVLTKTDLCSDPEEYLRQMQGLRNNVPVLTLNGLTGEGLKELAAYFSPGQTVVFVGSSGVGKSTLTNLLSGHSTQETQETSFDSKGRHTTTRKDFIFLPSGAMLIDTPGMKEFAPIATPESLAEEFADIESLAIACKYRNCDHQSEPGCAVQQAIAESRLEERRLRNYNKLNRERLRQESREFQSNQKRKWKSLSKQIRKIKKDS